MRLSRLIIAGTNSGVGKTTLTLGIISGLRKRGLSVQPFKTGPDYIDPGYHTEASGNICRNLDSWLLTKDTILELFQRQASKVDISIIEGVMGLYDGLKDGEMGSTAHLAKILNCPVILVLNARSMSRSAAAVVLGYKEFDKKVNIAGIILNNIGSENHYNYVKSSIERKTKIPVLGFLPKDANLKLPERHLGLVPIQLRNAECGVQNEKRMFKKLGKLVEENINLEKLIKIGRKTWPVSKCENTFFTRIRNDEKNDIKSKIPHSAFRISHSEVRIGIARDEAFSFYYQDNLDILENLGAKLVPFSPLRDKKLPDGIDGLYIGGGFPELFALSLSKNKKLINLIREKAETGMPIYAECGGLMYLVDTLVDFSAKGRSASGGKNRNFPMVGIFKCSVKMGGKLNRMGYVNVNVIEDNILSDRGDKNKAHIFHWSRLENIPEDTSYAYEISKGGAIVSYDGLIKGNVLAGYAHLHFGSNMKFAIKFIESCRNSKRRR